MPLLIMKTPTDVSTDDPNGVWDTVAHMLQTIDINRADFGTPELEWTSDLKSVFVVNAFRKPLDRNIVEAFGDFCKIPRLTSVAARHRGGRQTSIRIREVLQERR